MTNNTRLTLAVSALLLTFCSTIALDYNIYLSVVGFILAMALWFAIEVDDKETHDV
jgi:hypothetical protein